jgi:hypothetical protein
LPGDEVRVQGEPTDERGYELLADLLLLLVRIHLSELLFREEKIARYDRRKKGER